MPSNLAPAAQLAAKRQPPFAEESTDYAQAREALLAEEIEVRRHVGRLAAQIRALPPGPEITENYRFIDPNGVEIGLEEMFGGHDSLVIYHWMFGPDRERPCPMCTATLGSLNGNGADIAQRVALAVTGRSKVERQIAFAQERGWRDLRFFQSVGDDWALKIGGLDPDKGWEMPALLVLRRQGDIVRLHWMAEGSQEMADPGEDPRGAVELQALWNLLDLTPEGRGIDWYPKLDYPPI
ncbi:DUF899 family protein [Novosphingobium sp. PS1R-30]|uniref:DUF899 family protein n=1 Tax=Novosphingobium anseongense TaxID=3133436 RepID=A0ABU8RRI9_9SPHN